MTTEMRENVARRLPRRTLIGSLLGVVLLLSPMPPGGASGQNPTLQRDTCFGTCWASYVFRTDGAEVEFEVTAKNLELPIQLGAFLYDANSSGIGDKLVFAWTYLLMDADDGVLLSVNPGKSSSVNVDTRTSQSIRNSVTLTVTMNDDESQQDLLGRYRLLTWSAGNSIGETEHVLSGKTGSEFRGGETGTRTFLYTSADFEGMLNIQAGNGEAEGRVNRDLRKVVDIKNTMIGIFGTADGSPSQFDKLDVETPSGLRTCPCFFSSFYSSVLSPPPATAGRYTFRITEGADFQPGNSAEIVLGGVDARLATETITG